MRDAALCNAVCVLQWVTPKNCSPTVISAHHGRRGPRGSSQLGRHVSGLLLWAGDAAHSFERADNTS